MRRSARVAGDMGGFGFGMLVDVQMLGFFQAQHHATRKHFLAYVLQVTTSNSQFLIYRRYSQIAALAAKLHFHPAVALPPKYALQVFPLTEEQLKQRFEGLQAFTAQVFVHLRQQHNEGLHHDVNSTAGLDMQIFYDFISHHRNRPPQPVKTLPEWAKPSILHAATPLTGSAGFSRTSSFGSMDITESSRLDAATAMHGTAWQDVDSVDSEDVRFDADGPSPSSGSYRSGTANQVRNEILQAEGNLNALWNCVQAYRRATQAWWMATSAVLDEYKRISDLPLYTTSRESELSINEQPTGDEAMASAAIDDSALPAITSSFSRAVEQLQSTFDERVEQVLAPLQALVHEVLPDVKHSYWTRLAGGDNGHDANSAQFQRRLLQERQTLHEKLRVDVQQSLESWLTLQNQSLSNALCSMSGPSSRSPRSTSMKRPTDADMAIASVGETSIAKEEAHDSEEEHREDAIIRASSAELPGAVLQHVDDDRSDGRVWVWGRLPGADSSAPLILRPKQVNLLHGQSIVQIACGGEHLLYLTDTGDVYSFGDNEDKKSIQRSQGASFLAPRLVEEFALEKALHKTKIIRVACGAQHSVGITEAGELYTWGSGEDGRLGHGDMRDRSVPRKVMSLLRDRIIHASCGGAHTAVLTDKHTLFTFGRGKNGRLGLGDNKWRDSPHEVTAFPQDAAIVNVVCGWNFTAALSNDGKVFSWGKQGEGQCGLGYLDKDQLIPRQIDRLAGVHIIDLACGYTHTLALTSRGELYSWGLGEYGQLGRGIVYQPVPEIIDVSSTLCQPDTITRVHCGAFHSIATTEMHVMFAWGLNMYGACGLGHTSNKDSPERIDCFIAGKELLVACGHKYTIALEVDPLRMPPDTRYMSATSTIDGGDSVMRPLTISVVQSPGTADWAMTPTNFNGGTTPRISYHTEERENMHEKEEELRRAKKMWRTRILRDWEESKDTPLAHAMWRQGIPPSIRARVWPLAIGNKLKITPEMYQIYRKRAQAHKKESGTSQAIGREHTLALIDTDLPRTFPSLKLFDSSGPYYEYLLEVLETYACYRPDLGYIQGMSYLAAMLCLHMPQDRYLAFQCLANLMVNEHLFTFYLLDAELSEVYYKLFDEFLSSKLPKLHRHMADIGISCSMYLMNWLQTLYLQVLPLEVAARVFDNFLLDGTVFLFRTAMAIHELLMADLLRGDIDEVMPIIQKNVLYQDLWDSRVSEDDLFRTIGNVVVPSHIYSALDRVVNDVFFFEKRGARSKGRLTSADVGTFASGGQSVGIGRVKNERRRMYSISDTLNGVLGGF